MDISAGPAFAPTADRGTLEKSAAGPASAPTAGEGAVAWNATTMPRRKADVL